jgi:methyl-accepting chemotaxis protein
VLLLAAVIGILVGRRITRPIMVSIEYLRNSSRALANLASKQKSASTEQSRMVDSSHIGLRAVQYYTHASTMAVDHLKEVSQQLAAQWHEIDRRTAQRALSEIIAAARYTQEALQHQNSSNKKLSTAMKVTTNVNEQLSTASIAATEAAKQMEQIVDRLREVVGK